MTIKIRYLNKRGDSTEEVSLETAETIADKEQGKCYIVDAETKKIIRPVDIEDGQELILVPFVRGG